MKIVIRTDASYEIGSGHVMRCLTLADALKAQGADCHFISREHPGHLLELMRQRGYKVSCLTAPLQHEQAIGNLPKRNPVLQNEPAHAHWLGSTWESDAEETAIILAGLEPDWLVMDHYALDWRWEEALSPYYRRLMVVDDLADRPHRCDLLLNQNLGSRPQDYSSLVPANCQLLIGARFALLRPEFAELRPYSLQRRRAQPNLRQLLITMGGVDQSNATSEVLQALKNTSLPTECRITVVMGLKAPWLESVRELSVQMPWPTLVVINVDDMAQRMADSDLAIGAAGSTSWERCCLGLPTLMVVLAANQKASAQALQAANAAFLLGTVMEISDQLPQAIWQLTDPNARALLSSAAGSITQGHGTKEIVSAMRMHDV